MKGSDRYSYSAEQRKALFDAVLVHDNIDLRVCLPKAIHLNYGTRDLSQGYQLCREVWDEGVDRLEMKRMVAALHRERCLSREDAYAYKCIRARFKHLRFAYGSFGEGHRYPFALNQFVGLMGGLQDAFKNGQEAAVGRLSYALLMSLGRLPYSFVVRPIDRFVSSSGDGFRRYVLSQIAYLRQGLGIGPVSRKQFHALRKVVSRQVAVYDTFKVLFPSKYHEAVASYLGTLNGMMGRDHDLMIAQEIKSGSGGANSTFVIKEEIESRLSVLVNAYGHVSGGGRCIGA